LHASNIRQEKGNHQLISQEDTNRIKSKILNWGADLVGVADIEPLSELRVNPPDLLQGFARAVSIAIQLPISVFETILDKPTPNYSSAYKTANLILDQLAYKTAVMLQKKGYHSLPIPASQVLDPENWYAAISHKAVARMAGLGWQGKNLLLITPQFGSRVRLVTVLTAAPLFVDAPVKNRCGSCMLCRDACPAKAIRGIKTTDHYKDRNEALHFSRCVDKLTIEYAALPGIEASICGICIKVCPFGRKIKKGNRHKITF
jgi:epoxyqueuosine reductase